VNPWYKRSEFWLAAAGAAGLVLTDGLGMDLEGDTIISVTSIIVAYALGRGFVKGKEQEGGFPTLKVG
jgi:hypothetical protein